MLEDGPNALQFLEDCFNEVGWHATFENVFQISGYCYDPVLGCDIRVGNIFVLVEHCGRDSFGPGVLHTLYP